MTTNPTITQAVEEKDAEIARLRETLNRIANARTAMDGGSIQECRVLARQALQPKEQDDGE